MARQCTKPKRPKNSTWFKEKAMLAEALESGMEIPTLAAFQTNDLDAFDSDCDEAPSASAILMAKLSSYDSATLLEPIFNNDTDIDNVITSESNMISYEQYLNETENTVVQDTSSFAQHESMIMGNIVVKPHNVLSIIDTEETLELAEESRLKIHVKQNDPIMQEKKVNITPIDYAAYNKPPDHFVKHFVPQKQLSAEQAFWLPISKPVSEIPPVQSEPVLKEIPNEFPTISLVKYSFNKMRSHVNDFENVVTVRTKVTGLHKEITNMKEVFQHMETEVAKCSVERKTFEIKEKEVLLENDRLLELLISQDLVHAAVNSLAEILDYKSREKSFLMNTLNVLNLRLSFRKRITWLKSLFMMNFQNDVLE
ncbi:hypothetical protein Tco_0553785 [Tanacetum coccineum]